MESNIKKLSIREIISKVGFPITINEFRNTYKFNVDLQLAMEFEEQLKQINRMSEIEKIIFRYENIFDKEIYVFHLARLLEKDIENLKRAELLGQNNIEQLVFTNDITGKNKRRFFVNAKNLLKKCDVIDIVMKKKSKGEIEIYSSIDFIEENTEFSDAMEAESIEKFDLIEQKIGFENVLKYIEDTDLQDICRYSNLAMLLMVENEKLENKIKKYFQYIDLDKMLVLANSIYFYKYGENFYNFSKEEAYELKDFTEKVSEVVKDRVKFLQSSRFYFTIDYAEIKEKIKKLLEHVENVVLIEHNESIIEKEAEELTKEIIENEMPVEEIIYSEKEIIDQDDIFKTEIIKEENSNNISFESEEKVIGDIFELAKLEETIEEKNSEPVIEKTEILEKETKEVFVNESEEEFETENIEVEEAEIQETEMQEIINEIVDEKLLLRKNYVFTSTQKYKVFVNRLRKLLAKSMKYIIQTITSSEFEVLGHEVEFKENKQYPPIKLQLEDGKNIEIIGKIDRIDIAQKEDEKYLRIIDYKSSIKNIDLNKVVAGLQIQLLTYLDAVSKNEDMLPAGVLYFNLIDPIIKANKNMTEEEIEEEIKKKFKMQGLILADVNVVKMMDKNLEKGASNIVPAYIDKERKFKYESF